MLLKLDIPHGDSFKALYEKLPLFFSYILSYAYIGIYWNNHHQLFHVIDKVDSKILWLNLYLIFWLTMIPLATDWTASSNYAAVPTACYAFVLLMCSMAYFWLERTIISKEGVSIAVVKLLKQDYRVYLSILAYIAAVALSFVNSYLALLILIIVAAMWFLPNRKVEYHLNSNH